MSATETQPKQIERMDGRAWAALFVLSGAIAVEAIFSWPGLGLATYEALEGPDLPMLQGLFLVFSAAVILFKLLADLLYAYLDPRVRTA